jgi:hypothetical protein
LARNNADKNCALKAQKTDPNINLNYLDRQFVSLPQTLKQNGTPHNYHGKESSFHLSFRAFNLVKER